MLRKFYRQNLRAHILIRNFADKETMMMRTYRNLTALVAFLCCFSVWADVPLEYYKSVNGKKKVELKSAFRNVIKKATVLDYGSGTDHTWAGFYQTDRFNGNQVRDRYSYEVFYFPSNHVSAASGMNIEHSFPKSWWGGNTNQAYKDLYNLMPCESGINSSKSNYAMGKVTNVTVTNGCTKVGKGSAGSRTCNLWEPADEWKGDFARNYFYMVTTYSDLTWTSEGLNMLEQDEWPTLQPWAYRLFMEWSRQDPVDEIEKQRNEAVCNIQGNRNPFIDFPNLAEYIWGDSVDYAFDLYNTSTGIPSNEDKPFFAVSPTSVSFTAVSGEPSTPTLVTVKMDKTKDKTFTAQVDGPFELSDDPDADDEDWSKSMMLLGSLKGSSFYVRFSAQDKGNYKGSLTLSTKGVEDIVVALSAVVGELNPFFEDFEKGAKSSYAVAAVECSSATWQLSDALLAKDPNTNGTVSVRLKGSGVMEMQTDKEGGCDSLWFYAGNYGSDTGATLQVSYSLDAGQTWQDIVNLQSFDGWKRYGFAIQQPGRIRMKFKGGGVSSKRLNIDDIRMSHFDEETDLVQIQNSKFKIQNDVDILFDLSGRRVTAPHKPGIYIRNGKKIFVR